MNRKFITTGYTKQIITKVFFLISGLFLVLGCEKEETPKAIIAKVGDKTLTEERLDTLLSFTVNKNKYESEVIRDWVESEILLNEAKKHDILEREDYLQLADESNKKLASSIYLSDYITQQQIDYDDAVLMNFYNTIKEEMSINDNAYVYNRAVFNNEAKAVLFRTTLIESDWNKSINVFSGDEALVTSVNKKFIYDFEAPSRDVFIVLQNLDEGETSIIFETEPGSFNVVQLLKSYQARSIPEFEYVRESVKTRFIATKQTQLYKALMQKLFTKYDVIINR